ncbi:PREDICTED: ubiquitin-like protein ATG12 [Amphimedon queenslandica]|uniref:Ubiquitin-like protein ATG12 n=1 Tax=Amphimedon queenslandica TaxID=400682 RepID=A0A1X7V7J1_AMPQE|nr:PREDICTED: ubiquitin-like protein ATG12 [Amphimedon queenslandica]|eukprot:XP_003385427.1 PREDICTED: ubiquitin-like protein ATG12 [Amphimedon queenslandica]
MASSTELSSVASPNPSESDDKIVLSLRAAGNAPQLKHKKFAVEKDRSVAWVVQWLCQKLKIEEGETMFVYVQQAFAPPLDTDLETLYKNYGTGDKLVLTYCKTQAWG